MTLIKQIEERLQELPTEKQNEVLDFILFLQQRGVMSPNAKQRTLKKHPAFGAWQERHIDALAYQQEIRTEWGSR